MNALGTLDEWQIEEAAPNVFGSLLDGEMPLDDEYDPCLGFTEESFLGTMSDTFPRAQQQQDFVTSNTSNTSVIRVPRVPRTHPPSMVPFSKFKEEEEGVLDDEEEEDTIIRSANGSNRRNKQPILLPEVSSYAFYDRRSGRGSPAAEASPPPQHHHHLADLGSYARHVDSIDALSLVERANEFLQNQSPLSHPSRTHVTAPRVQQDYSVYGLAQAAGFT